MSITKTETMCLAFIKRYTPEVAIYNYTSGLCLEAVYKASEALNKPQWFDWVCERASQFLSDDGNVKGFDSSEHSMDLIRTGNLYWYLYNRTGQEKYKIAIESFIEMMKTQMRTPSGGYWHKKRYPNQMWLDGLYMAEPLIVKYSSKWGDLKKSLDGVILQFDLLYKHTVKENGLLVHAWDESCTQMWADPVTGKSPYVWSRAMGWVIMALPDIIELIPDTDEYSYYRQYFSDYSKRLAEAIIKFQDYSTGLWYQIPDMAGFENNYLESSGTLMFCYGFIKLYKMGILDNRFKDAAVKAWKGVVRFKTHYDSKEEFHLIDICKSAGLGRAGDDTPFRDGSYIYYTTGEERAVDNMHGVGAFILAGIETELGGFVL